MATRQIDFLVTVEFDEDEARIIEDDHPTWMPDTIATLATAMRTICEDNLPDTIDAHVTVSKPVKATTHYEPTRRQRKGTP